MREERTVCFTGHRRIDPFDEVMLETLLEKEIEILVNLGSGACGAAAWGCDLTYDYVKINGDYRT